MKCTIVITALIIISNLSFAAENNINLTLTTNETLLQSSIEELIEDSIRISIFKQSQWVQVDSIIEIKIIKKSKIWRGAGIGLLSGVAVGAFIGRLSYSESSSSENSLDLDFGPGFSTFGGAFLGGIGGTIIGGISGASSGKDEFYDLSQKTLKEKLKIIRSVISNKK